MIDLRSHPRMPALMPQDVFDAVADELDVTLAAYPVRSSFRFASPAHALTAYAERLEGITSVEAIRVGFKAARAESEAHAPTPAEVAQHCNRIVRLQRESQRAAERESDTGERADPVLVSTLMADLAKQFTARRVADG